MIWFFQLGRMIEALRGTVRLAIFILLIAVLSCVAQAIAPSAWGGTPRFGGMSGVVYGLFGYAWMKSIFDTQPGFYLGQSTVIIMLGWLFLCMTPAIPNVANVAHVVGLIAGIATGYLPTLLKH
jgi:GlpG protein